MGKNRLCLIFYVYQESSIAWKFTQAREKEEGRHIPKEAFIRNFLGAKNTVDNILKDFGGSVQVFVVKKNFETHEVEDIIEINSADKSIDDYVASSYTKSKLEKLL